MIQETSTGCILTVKVIPKARRSEFVGIEAEACKIRLAAIPEQGKANEELIRFVSKWLNIPKSRLELISGATHRVKRVHIEGLTKQMLAKVLES